MPIRNGHRRDEPSLPEYDESLLPPEAPKERRKDGQVIINPKWDTLQTEPPDDYEWNERLHRYTRKKKL